MFNLANHRLTIVQRPPDAAVLQPADCAVVATCAAERPPRSPGATSDVGPAVVRIGVTRSKTAIKAQAGGMVGRYNTRGESVGFGFTLPVGASGGREAACRSVVNLGTPH